MKLSEEQILQDISRLFADLETATYGKERSNGRYIHPSTDRFYYCVKRIYEATDELIRICQPDYVTARNYCFICDSRRTVLLSLEVFKDRKKAEGYNLTLELDDYYQKIQGLFDCILSRCNSKASFGK